VSSIFRGPQFPAPVIGTHPGTIYVAGMGAAFDLLAGYPNAQGSAAWPAANRAIFVPFEVPIPLVATRMIWRNGSAVSGNVDAGIYDLAGNRLASIGSTAQSGTSTQQSVDLTDTLLRPGVYLMALALDNTTGTIARWGNPGVQMLEAAGVRQMASAFPLPDPVTLAAPSSAYVPFMAVALHPTV